MAATLSIRVLEEPDAEALMRLRARAFATDPFAFGGTPDDLAGAVDVTRARLSPQTRASGAIVLGAFRPDLVGMLGLAREQPGHCRHKARLWGFYVEPSARGSRIGTRLLEAALAAGRTLPGLEQLTLQVNVKAAAAIRLYERVGFQTFGTEPKALKTAAGYFDELHMVAFLSA